LAVSGAWGRVGGQRLALTWGVTVRPLLLTCGLVVMAGLMLL
jgi:hypothetical protein